MIARNSSFVYKKAAISVPDVAKALGVRYVLEGSVRKAGNRIRVTAQLIDLSNGGHVWASRFDRDLTDIFAVQDELTQEIVAALKLKLTVGEQDRLTQRRMVDVEAYELFLRGREQSWASTRDGNIAAHGLLGRAIAIDPGYAAAHALIAFTHVLDYANAWTSDPEHSLRIGLELAQQVLQMDEEEPHGHSALAMAYMWSRDLDQAQVEAQRCLTLCRSPGWVAGDGPCPDIFGRPGGCNRHPRCIYAAGPTLSGNRSPIPRRCALFTRRVRRSDSRARAATRAKSSIRDRLCPACILLWPPWPIGGLPNGVGTGA